MIYYCQFLLGVLRRGRWGPGRPPHLLGDSEPTLYETCGEVLRWDGEHGLSCPAHGPRRIAERLQPIQSGSVVLEPSDVCTVPWMGGE